MDTAPLSTPFATTDTPVRCVQRGAVFQIELNLPDARNPLGPQMIDALDAALTQAIETPTARAVLITAAGPAFSAGGNLGNMAERLGAAPGANGKDPIALGNRRYGDFLRRLSASPKVVVASVRGAAMGGGAGLVCAADIAIGAQGAKFGFPEAAIGLVPGQILPFVAARIGVQAARRLMLTGERIDAAEAHRIGLLDYHVADAAHLDAHTDELLARILACAPGASATTKQMLNAVLGAKRWWSDELTHYLDEAADAFARQMRSEAIEGVAAAREKRAPNWQAAVGPRE